MEDLSHERLTDGALLRLALERVLTQVVAAAAANNHIAASAGKTNTSRTYAESFALAASAGALTKELAAALKPSAGLRTTS